MINPNGIEMRDEGTLITCRCGKVERLNLTVQEYGALYFAIDTGMGHIQDILPDRTPAERELCLSNMCYDCQRMLFGNPSEKLTEELRKKNSEEAYKQMHENDGVSEGTLLLIKADGTIEKKEMKGRATELSREAIGVEYIEALHLHPDESGHIYYILMDEEAKLKEGVAKNEIVSSLTGLEILGNATIVEYAEDDYEDFHLLKKEEVEELESKFDVLRKEAV